MDGRHAGSTERSRPPDGRRHRWHALVERYTPEGALGRLLLAAVTGPVAAFFSYLALATNPYVPLAILFILVTGAVGALFLLLTVAVCWPVYLSLIGNLESAADYPVGAGADRETTPVGAATSAGATPTGTTTSPGPHDSDEDAVAILKRRYAAGELSEEAFDRRLDDVLEADEALRTSGESSGGRDPGATGGRDADAVPEPERE